MLIARHRHLLAICEHPPHAKVGPESRCKLGLVAIERMRRVAQQASRCRRHHCQPMWHARSWCVMQHGGQRELQCALLRQRRGR